MGHRIDAEVLAEQIVPVERREAVPGPHPVGQYGGQHRPAAPRGDLDRVALRDAQRPGVLRVELHEGTGVELVQLGDLAGLGQGVPLVRQPAGVEHIREVVVGQLGRRKVRTGEEHGPATGGGEGQPGAGAVRPLVQGLADTVVEVAQRIAVGPVGGRAGPLHGGLPQPLIAHPAQVIAGLRVPGALDLLEYLLRALVAEGVLVPHLAGDPGDDPPVRPGLARGVGGLPHQRQIALRVDHHALGLGPHGGRQHHIGVRMGLGLREHVLRDDELGRLQPLDDRPAVGDRGDGVGADDPARLDVPVRHLPEHLDGALAGPVRPQRARLQSPQLLDEGPVPVHQRRALAGQARPHVAHLAAAHRVGLAGERERAAAGAADRPGRQMQVDQCVGVPGAMGALVQAHGPAAHPVARGRYPLRGPAQAVLRYPGDLRDGRGRIVPEEVRHRLPALGVLGDELRVDGAVLDQQVQQAVQQRQIRTGRDLKEQIGLGRGRGAPWIDHDQLGARLDPFHHPQEEDRMAVGHVRADDEEDVGMLEVLIRAGRAVRAQRQLVAAARARHAQPGVGLDVPGAHKPLGELVRQVLGLQGHLTGDVEGEGVRAVLVDDLAQPRGGPLDRRFHRLGHRLVAAVRAHQGGRQPPRRGEQLGAGRALRAQPSAVRRVRLVAGRLAHRPPPVRARPDIQHDPAADTAVRARRAHLRDALCRRFRCGHGRSPSWSDVPLHGRNRPLTRCHVKRSTVVTAPTQSPAAPRENSRRPPLRGPDPPAARPDRRAARGPRPARSPPGPGSAR